MEVISRQESFATAADFVKACQQWEKGGKRWGQYVGAIAGKAARVKTYGRSYPQILEAGGINYGGAMDMKPGAFAELVARAFPS
jgi:hypothetical protein